MMTAIGDSIIFSFYDQIKNGVFIEESPSGIIVEFASQVTGTTPRKVHVHAVGPDVTDIKPGMSVLVTPLMWTDMFKYKGDQYWKTQEKHIMGIYEST